MATYTTQAVISVETLQAAEQPEAVIAEAEETVRATLVGAGDAQSRGERGELRIGWLAYIPGHVEPGHGRGSHWEKWTPGDDLPTGTASLACRGRRTV